MGDDDPRLLGPWVDGLSSPIAPNACGLTGMEIIGTCINCFPALASLTINVGFAIAALSIAIYRTA
jgi:hypothetical protein